jgi:hypothetical protein
LTRTAGGRGPTSTTRPRGDEARAAGPGARDVEHVAQALAVGLEHDRELRVAARDLQQRLRLQPLLPQRRAAAGVGARDQQRAAGVLAEARAEQRGPAQLADDEVLELVGLDQDQVGRRRLVGVGEVDDDAVVGPDGRTQPYCSRMRRERQPRAACTPAMREGRTGASRRSRRQAR